jgi:heterodisulfide reductase subunit A-like polyferredoxin
MVSARVFLATLIALSLGVAEAKGKGDKNSNKPANCDWKKTADVEVDVAIIGGGASGSYAAVKLKDMGKSVVLIEREDHLVSHQSSN